MAGIEFRNVSKSFGTYNVIQHLDVTIQDGSFTVLVGPSGCGKTTILRLLGGFETPTKGDILFEGKSIIDTPPYKRRLNTVFQKYALFPNYDVYGNIAFGLKIKKLDKKTIEKKVKDMLKLVGLSGYENRTIDKLSGGQMQRVAIARALVNEPEVLLLDEPLGALDLKFRKEMQIELKRMQKQLGITFVYVTHDQEEAIEVADEIVVTNKGRIEQVGTPVEICMNPKTPFVAQFIGRGTIVSNIRAFSGFAHAPVGHAVVQPEFVHVFSCEEASGQKKELLNPGVVQEVSFRGALYELRIAACGETLNAFRSFEAPPLSPGDLVQFYISRAQGMEGEATLPLNNDRFV